MNEKDIKQCIIIRSDLKNSKGEKIRTGKLIAQGCHASIAFITNKIRTDIMLNMVEYEWISGIFKKICLCVDSEAELLDIHKKALEAGLTSNLITDSGLTEFNGVPTNTCIAIGPDYSEKIDRITGHLKLL